MSNTTPASSRRRRFRIHVLTIALSMVAALDNASANSQETHDMTSTQITTPAANEPLAARQQAIVPVAAFGASGDMARLNTALNQGLDAGLTISDAKEILVQLYAYAGFPRSLNALGELIEAFVPSHARSRFRIFMNQLSLAGTQIDHFHICAFFDSRDAEYDVLLPFFKEGLDQGEKNLHIVNPIHMDAHRSKLAEAGINVHDCEACGQLEITPWHWAYLDESGAFDKDRMIQRLKDVYQSAKEAGFPRVRVMGNMDWVFADVPGADDILAYEAAVNEIQQESRQPAVCVYDLAKLSGSMMMDLLRTHPLTLINGVVQENPFYTPPAQMLAELNSRKAKAQLSAT